MVEVLNALSTRPPTPPRTSDLLVSTQSSDRSEETTQYFQTPRDSPASRRGSTGISSTRGSKRVNFSPWTRYIKPPTFGKSTVRVTAELKGPLPSNDCKPVKSILKPAQSPAPVPSPDVESYKPESFAMLLESVTQQLAGDSASSHVDAYMHLLGALRAYDGIPGPEELGQKIGIVTQFLQRDINRDTEKGGPLETNIIIQALKLSIAFIWHPTISQSDGLSDDFKIYLVERAIDRLQAVKTPKSIVTHCMHILVTQNFSPKIMTNARLARLLTTLHDLTSRVNGNAIVSQRLSIYQRLLDQSRAMFVSNASLWMEHLVSGLLHPLKDTRLKAIALGFQISTTVGPNPTLSRNIRDVFDRPLDKGRKLVKEICERMSRMMANTDSGMHVPQIWSIIVLLLRNKKASIEKWDCFKEWALVLQKCFNCSESAIKAQAILAWNRFVFVVGPSESTTSSMIKMLGKPVLSQFERKRNDKIGTQPSQLALTSYYNLLYYAFRPAASHQQCDLVWEEYMAAPSSTTFSSSPQLCDRVSRALSSLLWSPQAKFWSENRVNEGTTLEPEELPSLDCKWVRSRVGSVLKVFENLFRASTWDDDHIGNSNIAVAWLGLSKALSSASSKEITPTTESMQAVSHLLGLLQRLWNTGPSSLNATGDADDKFVERFRFLSTTMIVSVGSGPFTDKLLLRTAGETFQLASTPTHRHPRTSSLDNPILHLLRIISGPSEAVVQCQSYSRLINDTLRAACSGKVSRASRLEFLGQCADLNAEASESVPAEERSRSLLWRSTANLAADCLRSFPGESARERDGTVTRDYEVVRHILSTALEMTGVSLEWDMLLESFLRVVRTERGDGALAAVVVEPVAKSLLTATLCDDTYGLLGALINRSLSIPFQAQASQSSQNSAPRMSLDAASTLDSGNLVQLIHRALQASYAQFEPSKTRCFVDFIESLTSFLGSGALDFRSTILENIQRPLSIWLGDDEHKLDVDRGVESRVLTAYRALASSALNILQSLESHDATCLEKYESLVCSGLTSTHVSVSKRFVKIWEATFGLQESLNYSERIHGALQNAGILHGQDQLDSSSTSGLQVLRWNEAAKRDITGRRISDPVDLPAALGFNSSPVVKAEDVHIPAQLRHSHARALDTRHLAGTHDGDTSCIGITTEVANAEVPVGEKVQNRADIFTVIADIRSSSPTSTPRDLEFRTPPHLRSLQDVDRPAGTPLTPIFAAINVENEEPFGSSPTPGTRHCPTVTNTTPSLSVTGRECAVVNDPPSSPPEFRPSQRKERKRSGSRASTLQREINYLARKTSEKSVRIIDEANVTTEPVSNVASGAVQSCPEELVDDYLSVDEQLPFQKQRRSLRSTNSRSNSTPSTPAVKATHQNPKDFSKSDDVGNKDESRDQQAIKPTPTNDFASILDRPESVADSSSDDMEVQIASQLEQDMVLAGNADEQLGDQEPAQLSHSYPLTRKRKREFSETPMTPQHPRRRSSRSALGEDLAAEDVPEARTTRSGRLLGSQPLPNVRDSEITPSRLANKKRKTQKAIEAAAEVTAPEEQDGIPSESDIHGLLEASEPSPEKRRRSLRLGGQAPLLPVEESPGKKDSGSESHSGWRSGPKHYLELDEPLTEVEETQEVVAFNTISGQTGALVEEAVEGAGAVLTGTSRHDLIEAAVESQLDEPDDAQEQQPADKQHPKSDIPMRDAEPIVADENITVEAMQGTFVETDDSREVPTEDDEVTETAILDTLRRVLDNVKKSSLSRSALREVDDLLFEIRVETHEANRRHGV